MIQFTNKIICGDCAVVMAEWPPDVIPLTVTSPPYDNLRDYEGYHFDFEAIAAQLWRVTRPGGASRGRNRHYFWRIREGDDHWEGLLKGGWRMSLDCGNGTRYDKSNRIYRISGTAWREKTMNSKGKLGCLEKGLIIFLYELVFGRFHNPVLCVGDPVFGGG